MIEVLKQALDALEKVKRRAVVMGSTGDYREGQLDALKAVSEDVKPAIASLQQAIKDLESQEPVAWIAPRYEGGHENLEVVDEREFGAFRVYTHPSQRTWQEQNEPFGYFRAEPFGWTDCAETDEGAIALYQATQRTWQGLTDEEIEEIRESTYQEFIEIIRSTGRGKREPKTFVRAIEAKLKQKNGYAVEKNT